MQPGALIWHTGLGTGTVKVQLSAGRVYQVEFDAGIRTIIFEASGAGLKWQVLEAH